VPGPCFSDYLLGQKYLKGDYICGLISVVMNIQLVFVLILFAVAVYLMARKIILSFGKKKSGGCANCGSDQIQPKN
jgi:hypothetical protein